jgi:hypothetical protein
MTELLDRLLTALNVAAETFYVGIPWTNVPDTRALPAVAGRSVVRLKIAFDQDRLAGERPGRRETSG